MSRPIEVINSHEVVWSLTESAVRIPLDHLVIVELPEGTIQEYADALFSGPQTMGNLFAKEVQRTEKGHGAHFDLYGTLGLLKESHPFIATLNLNGMLSVEAAPLPEGLHSYYLDTYPEPSEKAAEARRHLGQAALLEAGDTKQIGELFPGRGLIVPQNPRIRPVVHNVVPRGYSQPGSFVKFAVPADTEHARSTLVAQGYKEYGEFNEQREATLERARQHQAMMTELSRPVTEDYSNHFDDEDFDPWAAYHVRLD